MPPPNNEKFTFVAVNSKENWNPVWFLEDSKREAEQDYWFKEVQAVHVLKSSHQERLQGSNIIPITIGPCDKMVRNGTFQVDQNFYDGKEKGYDKCAPKYIFCCLEGDHWSWLPQMEDDGLRLHHLDQETMLIVINICQAFLDFIHANSKLPWALHLPQKLGWTLGQAKSVFQQRAFRGIFADRRTDFVLSKDIQDIEVGHLYRLAFPDDVIDWLTLAPDIPSFSSWHGKDMTKKLRMCQLLSLFARNARDECWTNFLAKNMLAPFPAQLKGKWDKLEIGKIVDKASVLNGCLVWIVDARTLEEEIPELGKGGLSNMENSKAWSDMFNQGTLHIITKGDVTRSEITVHPPLHKNRDDIELGWFLSEEDRADLADTTLRQTPGAEVEIDACM